MKIWAHRGCSQRYPENTLTAFEKAAELYQGGDDAASYDGAAATGTKEEKNHFCGIELDVQLTKDGEIVVIHDERIDRTTDGFGFVRDYTLEELKTFHIHTGKTEPERIPTIVEVLDLLEDKMKQGMKLNIELKNSIYPYSGMEEKMADIVRERGMEDSIVWSSFSAKSLGKVRKLLPDAEIGILDRNASDCLYKLKGGCGANAIHPYWQGMDVTKESILEVAATVFKFGHISGSADAEWEIPVRVWLSGHLYPEKPTGGRLDLEALEKKGITDVFLNEPEVYL